MKIVAALMFLMLTGCSAFRTVPIDETQVTDIVVDVEKIDGRDLTAETLTTTVTAAATSGSVPTTTLPPGIYSTWARPMDSDPRPENTGVACMILTAPLRGYLFATFGAECFYQPSMCDPELVPPNDPSRKAPQPHWPAALGTISDIWSCQRWPGKIPICRLNLARTTFRRVSATEHLLYGFQYEGGCFYKTPEIMTPEEPVLMTPDLEFVPEVH